ncbi:hypothetical protein BDZ97DRAFT_1918962 [Flammula alnicola]|nr:hypothetical protein BDZ97DRAFT_1918962 [Flammula alnicola]
MSPAGGIGLFESTAGPQDSWYSAHHLIHAYDWGRLIKALHCCPSHHLQAAILCSQPEPSTTALNSFINDIFKRIATEASRSLSSSSREIQTSVCMMAILNSFANDIFKHIAITKVATYYTRPVLGRSTTTARTHLGARRSSILLTCMSL